MLKVKAGDIDKLGLLYERYHKMLFGFFWRMSGSRDDSEDLVHNVFYQILKYRGQFRGKGKFISWMFQIAHNLWADHYKKNKRTYQRDDLEHWELNGDLGADEQIEKEERARQLRKALHALQEDKKEVLILSRIQGLKYREIAEITGSTEGAVKTKVCRAMADLREEYIRIETR